MPHSNKYLPLVFAVFVVLLFGWMNLKCFRVKAGEKEKALTGDAYKQTFPKGYPSFIWLGLFALVAGLLVHLAQEQK